MLYSCEALVFWKRTMQGDKIDLYERMQAQMSLKEAMQNKYGGHGVLVKIRPGIW